MRESFMKRLLCMILVIAMVAAYALPAVAVDFDKVSFKQVDNNRVSASIFDRESVKLSEEEAPYADHDVVRVSIVLEKAGTIEAGYSTMNIATNRAAMTYRGKVEKDQATVTGKIEKAINQKLDVVWNLTLAANIISANVQYGQIKTIEKIAGVKSVIIETRYEPDVVSTGPADPNMATSSAQIGSSAVWGAGFTGAGSTIAVIDTGVDVEHEAFNSAAFDYSLSQLGGTYDLMDATDIAAVLSELNAYTRAGFSAADMYVNSKIPFGFNYVDRDLDVVHINDNQGEHGSHVAGIATANAYVNNGDGTFSRSLETTMVQGVAPDAQLLVMKVFGKNGGAYDSDYMAAIEDAVILGADSINLSLGSGNPGPSRANGSSAELGAYQDILENLEKSGVVVAFSAGNSGYWSVAAENGLSYSYLDDVSFQTNGSPGSYTNAFTVASVNNDGVTATHLKVGDNIVPYTENTEYGNAPITTLAGTHEFVFVNAIGKPEDFAAVGSDVLSGKIVMCYRGETSFFEKANAAVAAGAAAVIIVNNQAGLIGLNLTGYEYTAPVVSILQVDGELFKAAGTEHTTESGITYWTGSMEVSASLGAGQYKSEYYTMSSFSSWGVPGSLELKPEITAPGGYIYSVAGAWNYQDTTMFGDHASYEVMSGTSMASPQVAGMAALMAQFIRETGLDVKTGLDERTLTQSLLMSTAVPLRDAESEGNYYPVIQQGAGLANVGAATMADSYILMGANATASYADGKVKAELGDDPEKTGVYTFSFTINNLTDVEKTFALSADVFTQNAFAYQGILLLDTWTTNLSPSVAWTVNGKSVEGGEELIGLDFNGDGKVDADDGQILLDFATGLNVTLSNADKADLDGDGDVDSYDSYLFFVMLNAGGAVVPANGSAEVTVTITLSDADRQWLANYENGAYIEAYVNAESLSSEEGVAGTAHSIPMLAFYGNWSDASMFDKGSYVEFAHGTETRPPYLYNSAYEQKKYNGILVSYAGMDGQYWFGGNPMVNDATYMPERNAISAARGDTLTTLGFTLIRNAADSYYQIVDNKTGSLYVNQSLGPVNSAYYHVNSGTWKNTYYTLNLGLNPNLPEDTSISVGIAMIPEYYVDAEGNVDWAALGDGVGFFMPMVVDNTAPTVGNVDIDNENDVMTVTATDNQYIAAVALYDSNGQIVYTYTGSNATQGAGDTVDFQLDLSKVNGIGFLLQVYDYARNVTTYEINTQIGEVTEEVESVALDKTSVIMHKGETNTLTATVYPTSSINRDVVWSSSDETVVTVDETGKLTAIAAGTATITVAAAVDETVTATCSVTVIEITTQLNAIVWDAEGGIWFSQFAANALPNYEKLSADVVGQDYFVAAAVADDGTLYASSLNPSTGTGALYTVDPVTYQATKLSDCVISSTHIFYSDLTYVPAMYETGALLGTYGPYVISIDPVTGQAIEIVDEYNSEVVGITTCYGQLGEASDGTIVYQDVVYVIQNDGTVIQEIYYGYGGVVVPYMAYFYGERASFSSGKNVGEAWYYNSAYYDGQYLFWAAFDVENENAVTLYAIDADNSEQVFTLGKFADGVWPVGGLHQLSGSNTTDGALFVEGKREIVASEIQLVAKAFPVKEAMAGGSLNAISGNEVAPVRPASYQEVDQEEGEVRITVTAKDLDGKDVDSTNGVMTVTYDADALTLVEVRVEGDYTSVNPADIANADGTVTFGYVSLEGIAADTVVATLIFTLNTEEDTTVTVTHKEVNDQASGYVEELVTNNDCDHVWGNPVFNWSEDHTACTVTYTCANGCGETVTYDCVVTSKTTEATCDEPGKTVYTATYGEDSDVVEVEIPADGHDWADPVFNWSEDHTACTVTYTCANGCGETVTYDCVVTSKTTEATCDEPGKTVYTATYGEDSDVVEVEIPADGHDWADPVFNWSEDHTACTVTYTCANGCGETVTYDCVVTSKTTEATCDEPGKTVYTATYGEDSDVVEVEIPADGHDWADPVFNWSDDHSACTVTYTCANGCKETVTYDCVVTSETTEATCEEPGKTVYTATYGEDSDVKEVEIPSSGHDWIDPVFNWSDDHSACTVTYTCANGCKETVTYDCVVTSETTKATCEEPGKTVYTATYGEDSDVVEVEIPASGHDYENGVCKNCGEDDPTPPPTGDTVLLLPVVMFVLSGLGIAALTRKKFFA